MFDPDNNYLIAAEKGLSHTTLGYTRENACPAKYQQEQEFYKKYSLYNAALFIQQYTEMNFSQLDICDKPYKLSLTLSVISGKWEFGYEVSLLYDNLPVECFIFELFTSKYEHVYIIHQLSMLLL